MSTPRLSAAATARVATWLLGFGVALLAVEAQAASACTAMTRHHVVHASVTHANASRLAAAPSKLSDHLEGVADDLDDDDNPSAACSDVTTTLPRVHRHSRRAQLSDRFLASAQWLTFAARAPPSAQGRPTR